MFTIVVFVAMLSLLVFVHEWGHFATARKLGVKAEEFGFGFPPRIAGIYKSKDGKWKKVIGNKNVDDAGDTVYSLNWFPLGGFVKIKGEDGEDAQDSDSFSYQKPWKRALILVAGVIMNIVLAFFLISIAYMIGAPQNLDNISSGANISNRSIQIVEVYPNSPADKAGFKMGDKILSVDGKKIVENKNLQDYLKDKIGQEITYKISRSGKKQEIRVIPEDLDIGGAKIKGIGVAIVEVGVVKYSFFRSIWEGIKTTFYLLFAIIVAFYKLIKDLVMGNGFSGEVAGPVGIAKMTGDSARMGFSYLLQFTSLLSINLAVINILPFPALDGGRLLFLFIEKIKGRPVRKEVEAIIHNIGFILLLILIFLVTYKDIFK